MGTAGQAGARATAGAGASRAAALPTHAFERVAAALHARCDLVVATARLLASGAGRLLALRARLLARLVSTLALCGGGCGWLAAPPAALPHRGLDPEAAWLCRGRLRAGGRSRREGVQQHSAFSARLLGLPAASTAPISTRAPAPQPTRAAEAVQHAQHSVQRLYQIHSVAPRLEPKVEVLDQAGQHLHGGSADRGQGRAVGSLCWGVGRALWAATVGGQAAAACPTPAPQPAPLPPPPPHAAPLARTGSSPDSLRSSCSRRRCRRSAARRSAGVPATRARSSVRSISLSRGTDACCRLAVG